jgi:hypothetical protein
MCNERLSDRSSQELIEIMEEAQRLLDDRIPLNPTDLICPQCGQSKRFRVELHQWADLDRHGADPDLSTDPAWGAESACNCTECEYTGRVADYLVQGQDTKPDQA